MPDDIDVQNRMYACFGGYEDRDCSTCIAYHSGGGPCCFSRNDKFDADDDSKNGCQECPHFDNCAEECGYELVEEEEKPPLYSSSFTPPFQQQQKKPASRITIRGSSQPRQPIRSPYTQPVSPVPARRPAMTVGQLAKVGDQYGRTANTELFFKQSIWGSIRGFLHGALDFVDTHRWE